jgi:hypothetical protein
MRLDAHGALVGLTTADIAWPIVLIFCVGVMVLPFVFFVVVGARPGHDEST